MSGNGWCVLFGLQLRRFLVQTAQTRLLQATVVRLAVGLLMGAAWYDQARPLFAVVLNSLLDTTFQTVMLLPTLQPLILQEWRNGYYGLSSTISSLVLCHMLVHTVQITAMATPVFFLAGLRGSLVWYLGTLILVGWLGVVVGIAVGSQSGSFQEAQQLIVPVILPMVLFSGYLVPAADLAPSLHWIYDISFFQHALAVLQINQWRDDPDQLRFGDCPPAPNIPEGSETQRCVTLRHMSQFGTTPYQCFDHWCSI